MKNEKIETENNTKTIQCGGTIQQIASAEPAGYGAWVLRTERGPPGIYSPN